MYFSQWEHRQCRQYWCGCSVVWTYMSSDVVNSTTKIGKYMYIKLFVMSWSFFYVQWFEVRVSWSLCWYWWNCSSFVFIFFSYHLFHLFWGEIVKYVPVLMVHRYYIYKLSRTLIFISICHSILCSMIWGER